MKKKKITLCLGDAHWCDQASVLSSWGSIYVREWGHHGGNYRESEVL